MIIDQRDTAMGMAPLAEVSRRCNTQIKNRSSYPSILSALAASIGRLLMIRISLFHDDE
jgi:hypothetical protein